MRQLIRKWLGLQSLYEWSRIIEASYTTLPVSRQGKTIQPTPEFEAEQAAKAEEVVPEIKKGYDAPVR